MPKKSYHHGDLKNALVKAGAGVLAKEGLGGFSLRKVARKAGVSHAAPYAHFTDRQSLIAAISTDGFNRLYQALDQAIQLNDGDPLRQLSAGARAYVEFALGDPERYKITFSGVLEKEKNHPEFVEASQRAFSRVVSLVQDCQAAGILRPGTPDLLAVTLWSQLHGLVSLLLEGQISHTVLDRHSVDDMLVYALGNFTKKPIRGAIR
jgi:AcrR family transcriptional regulator